MKDNDDDDADGGGVSIHQPLGFPLSLFSLCRCFASLSAKPPPPPSPFPLLLSPSHSPSLFRSLSRCGQYRPPRCARCMFWANELNPCAAQHTQKESKNGSLADHQRQVRVIMSPLSVSLSLSLCLCLSLSLSLSLLYMKYYAVREKRQGLFPPEGTTTLSRQATEHCK